MQETRLSQRARHAWTEQFWSKETQNFVLKLYQTTPWRVLPSKFCNVVLAQLTRMMGLPDGERSSVIMQPFQYKECRRVTDERTGAISIERTRVSYWAFTRYDRRTDWSDRPRLHSTGRSNQSDRPVGQTVAEPPTSVNQINVAC